MALIDSEKEVKIPWPFECFVHRIGKDGPESMKVSSFGGDFNRDKYSQDPEYYSKSVREAAETRAKAKVEEMYEQGWYASPALAAKAEEKAKAAKLATKNPQSPKPTS